MFNQVQIIGRVGQEPEVRVSPNGSHVCNISVATNENWKDKQGQKQERTEWHNVVAFAKLAEIMGNYLHKGSLVFIQGRLKTDKYEDKDGITRYKTNIVAREMKMLDGKGAANDGDKPVSNANAPHPSDHATPDFDDDVPF
jgi:single-strand DNA-binding protein